MTTLNDFFATPTEPPHPRLRDWTRRLGQAGTSATLEIFRPSPDNEFGQSRPEMYVQFAEGGKPAPLETVPWDDDLNAGLIRLKVRSVSPQMEAERFALGLRAGMRKAEREFGDGYFNAVLLELVNESDLTRHPEIAKVIRHAHANPPHREGGAFDRYTVCRELIAGAISRRAKELTGPLGYSEDEAKPILVSALARYLDERFSVTSRERLGLL